VQQESVAPLSCRVKCIAVLVADILIEMTPGRTAFDAVMHSS
jgi:hypothetical protein